MASHEQWMNVRVTSPLGESLGAAVTAAPTASRAARQPLFLALQSSSLPFLHEIKIILLRQLHHREQRDILFICDFFSSLI